ncbi:hypothetical protein J2Y69_000239 [Microbacterium resistens]|uniref:Uncharacterized protein n=1 Tax=Microbacterium resistens TaxID=156977 RepID=A0ABU1SA11_9MICO|nr:hypothetical protein [Microbacterium resistens]MDR6865657.1 hypothetical protein [Microbacterium resistens]
MTAEDTTSRATLTRRTMIWSVPLIAAAVAVPHAAASEASIEFVDAPYTVEKDCG